MCCYCACCTGEVRLHQEARFRAKGFVRGLCMARDRYLVAFGTKWAAVFDRSGQQQARLQLPTGCKLRGVIKLGSHLVLTDMKHNSLQV